MKNYIVTISREFGCGAREIGRDLALKLNVPFYDKELVDMAAEKAGVHADFIKDADEVLPAGKGKLFSEFTYGSSTAFYSEKAIHAQASVIREIAEKNEPCVLFGRCADYILRKYPDTIHFFLYAPLEARISHIAKDYEMSEKDSLKMIKKIDKQRHNYYKYVTGENRGDRKRKNVMIDVEAYGVKGTVDLMYQAIQIMFPEE